MHDAGYLNLCDKVFEKIYVPKLVYDEIKQSGISPLIAQVEGFIRSGFFIVKGCGNTALVNSLRSFLGPGEAETIALAIELEGAEVVILDESKARNLYKRLGPTKRLIGTIGILKFMVVHGLIKESPDKVVTKLEQAGFRFKKDLFKDC